MTLNRKLLENVFSNMGYEIEFDSDTPGIMGGDSVISWDDVSTINCLQDRNISEDKIKTAKLKNVSVSDLTNKLNDEVTKTTYKLHSSPEINYSSDTWRLIA